MSPGPVDPQILFHVIIAFLGDEVASATVVASLSSSMFTIFFRKEIVQTSQVCGGTTSSLRSSRGASSPYHITLWCAGRHVGFTKTVSKASELALIDVERDPLRPLLSL